MPLRPGETFGRYRLADLLGQGAMGEVYSAYDTVLRRKVALKVLSLAPDALGASASSTKGAARILREAQAAAGITHPNAVSIYDVGEVGGVSFLAMELVAGHTLRTFIGDESIPLARRLRWVVDVARALGAAHQLGLVHRDIKPENVMVRADGFVKVLDFGIARRPKDDDETPPSARGPLDIGALEKLAVSRGTLTAEGAVVGTPMYMAPEQLQGERVDGRTDQFAWGVLAYEVLTGRIPWDGEGVMLLAQILSQEVAPLGVRSSAIPAAVDATIRKALTKAPDGRFGTMEEIAEALEPFATSSAGAAGANRSDAPSPSSDAVALAATEQISITPGALAQNSAQARTAGAQVRERRAAGRAALGVGAAATAIALVGLGAKGVFTRPTDLHVAVDASPVDPPSQLSANHEAAAAFSAGMQAYRDASFGSAQRQLAHAIELDPLFALAHLRLALVKVITSMPVTGADLEPARNSRATLSSRDQALLDAFEPYVLSPPDLAEAAKRLALAVQKYPDDADLGLQHAIAVDNAGDAAKAREALAPVLARDPTFAAAWYAKGEIEIELDDVTAGLAAYDGCLKVSPGATTCLSDLAMIQANEGKCKDLVATSRRIIDLVPNAPPAYRHLAEGLYGSGEPLEAVRAALAKRWSHEEPSLRETSRLYSEAGLAVLAGDFAAAHQYYENLDAIAATHDERARFLFVYPRMLMALETGRFTTASRLAEDYVSKMAGLVDATDDDNSLKAESVELLAGSLSRGRFEKMRDEWLARYQPLSPSLRWINAYAIPAQNREDALAALIAQPAAPLTNALYGLADQESAIGHVYALAGRLDEAIPRLSRASRACNVIDGPQAIFSTWAAYDLGEALEARGDLGLACDAYARVSSRWRNVTPASRTATKAAARMQALACPRRR